MKQRVESTPSSDYPAIYEPSLWQKRFHALNKAGINEALGAGSAGPGKALALDTPIRTTTGFKPMGQVRPGDRVFDENGIPCNVVAESQIWDHRSCYRITFDDGSSIVADGQHEWLTVSYRERQSMRRQERCSTRTGLNDQRDKVRRPQVRTTNEIAATLRDHGRVNHAVMCGAPYSGAMVELPMDPYVLGLWLGDGSSSGAQLTCADEELITECRRLGYPMTKLKAEYLYGMGGGAYGQLRGLGLLGAGGGYGFKHIPKMYTLVHPEQRLALLQGLVDSDGHIDKDGRVEITQTNNELARDVFRLICGLGFKVTMAQGVATLNGRVIGPKWRICWSPMGRQVARLTRKRVKIGEGKRTQRWRYIVSCEPVPSVPTKCIQVDSPSHLFLAGEECIPTHNSLCLLMDIADQITVEHERCSNPKHPYHLEWGQSTGWALHLRRTRLQLEQTIKNSHKLFKALDPGATWNEQKSTWTFTSGFTYQFGHCKDPNDWESYMSSQFTAIYFDELTAFLEEQYDQICTRLRSTDPVLSGMLRIRSMSNPLMRQEGSEKVVIKDPHWVRRRFVDKAPEGNKLFKKKLVRSDGSVDWHKWIYLPAKLSDNPNPEYVKQYELQLLKSPAHIRKALLDGDWYVTVGSFFAEYWSKSLHVCKPFKIPSDWRVFRSMDWGFKAPGCIHWYALDDENTLYVFKELRFQGKTDEEVAAMVRAIEEQYDLWDGKRSRITGVADTQLWEQRGGSGKNMGQVFLEKGVPWLRADKKSRQTNAGHVIKRLSDHDSGTRTPGLVIFETCKWVIQMIPSIQTSQHNSEEPADGGDDHPVDSLFYGCAFASKGKSAIPPRTEPKSEWEEEDESTPDAKRRGQHGYGQELC